MMRWIKRSRQAHTDKVDRSLDLEEQQLKELREIKELLKSRKND
jgi:hypothetical protein